jgi:hypothetical protein
VDGKSQFQLSSSDTSLAAKFSPDGKRGLFMDFSGSPGGLVIGDLASRKLTPLAGTSLKVSYPTVLDWK